MITRIEIDGFKTFDRFSLDVPPFLVLLGANGSGKSNLLEAVALLGRLVRDPSGQTLVRHARRGGPRELFRRRPDGSLVDEIHIGANVLLETSEFGLVHVGVDAYIGYREAPDPLDVEVSIGGVGSSDLPLPEQMAADIDDLAPYVYREGPGESPRLDGAVYHALRRATDGWRLLDPLPDAMRQPADAYDAEALTEDGRNLGAVLGRLWKTPERRSDFLADVAAVLPDVREVDVVQDKDQALWDVWIQHKYEPRMAPRVVSGGTLRVLALLAAAHDPAHPGVLMVEEPENGLHPNRVPRLLERLKGRVTDLATYERPGEGDHGALRQIIVTSHSPVVLASLLDEASQDVVFMDTVTRLEKGKPPARLTRARRVGVTGERGTYVTPMEVSEYLNPVGYAQGLRYLSIALVTEGLSDQWFLLPLIDRQVAAMEPESAPGFDFEGTAPGSRFTVAPRDQVVQEVALLLEHMDIVLIHHDHNERSKVESVRARLGSAADRLVGIVPVRETEAWMLADAAALPTATAEVSVRNLVRSPREVERVPDPKKALAEAFGPRHRPEYDFDRLGQRVSLAALQQVPAYARWVGELRTAMERLRFL